MTNRASFATLSAHHSAQLPRARRRFDRGALLASASLLALHLVNSEAMARSLGGSQQAPSAAAIAAQTGSQEAARAAQNSLKRATMAIQALQASQRAARDAARTALQTTPSGIPHGLRPGGLQVVTGATAGSELWQGANLPTQFNEGDRAKVTIGQTQQKAILTWQTFSISEKTDLRFDQNGNRDWVALNRVLDNTAPSKILGSIKADGSVYIINQSGIIFGGTSQVNVGSLIASTAKISNEQFRNGIYSAQAGSTWTPTFSDAAELLGNGRGGGVIKVEAGAQIETNAPPSVTSGGGFVLLMGGEVVNAGTITTHNGQTQLAAGDDFVLRRGYSTEANLSSTTRGNEIAPLFDSASVAGLVRNHGIIFSPQGDITMAGRTIRQDGVLVASTSVNTRGTIHLLNSAADTLGSVTLCADSVTVIIPELESNETALNSQRDALIATSATANQQRSQSATGVFNNLSLLADRLDQLRIEIVTGGEVVFEGGATPDAGSLTIAQGGQVAVSAGRRISTESGATVDASGVRDVVLAMSANNLMLNIQGNELRDSPQNRDSNSLKNANVWVDIRDLIFVPAGTGGYDAIRYYTPGGLLEVGGYLANTKHTIGEWTAVGGKITLSASEVIAQKGSIFDISGGSVRYEGGYIRTTNFLGPDGRTYNVNNARGDMTFYGLGQGYVRNHERWAATEVWTSLLTRGRETVRWEAGYTVGRDAGNLILSTPTALFEADILADVVQGSRQTNARPDGITDGYQVAQNTVAKAGTLALGRYAANGLVGAYATDVVIADLTGLSPSAIRTNTAWFDAGHLNAQGLGGIDLATTGKITIDAPLSVADGGSVSLAAPVVDIKADVTAHSGRITATNILTAWPTSQVLTSAGTSTVTLGAGVVLDASGYWVNAVNDLAGYGKQAFINGGDVRLISSGDVVVKDGSLIDVSSGAALTTNGKFLGGRGGNVTLKASATLDGTLSHGGRLTLDGKIRGFGVAGGGALAITSGGTIVFGGDVLQTNGRLGAGEKAPTDLISLETFVVRAGEVLPANYSYSTTVAAPGQVMGASPNITSTNRVTLAADWTPPRPAALGGFGSYALNVNGAIITIDSSSPLPTIRAGSEIRGITDVQNFPQSYVVPADVFPAGIPIVATTVTAFAGSRAPVDVTFAAGTVIRSGSVLRTGVAVRPLEYLSENLLQGGFSQYQIAGGSGLIVAPRTRLHVTTPVYRRGLGSLATPTGADPKAALELWTPPQYIDNPAKAEFTQRAGADLSLISAGGITLASDSIIEVDDGRSVALKALGQITIEGAITARSGTITIASNLDNVVQTRATPGQSIWIGEHAVLDVSARPVTNADTKGRRYGIIRDGGSINIGMASFSAVSSGVLPATHSFVIIRPGARLDASGSSGVIDLVSDAGMSVALQPITVASNGGSITIGSQSGLYLDGEMLAATGGAGAAGGRLTIALETPSNYNPITAAGPRVFTITQERQTGTLTGLSPGLMDSSLRYGEGYLSSAQVAQGGFDTLSLWSRDTFQFNGDVHLSTGQTLALYRGVLSTAADTPNSRVSLSAPYVLLDGAVGIEAGGVYSGLTIPVYRASASNNGSLTVTADLIDARNRVLFGVLASYQTGLFGELNQEYVVQAAGFAQIDLVSRGDIRFGTGALAGGGNIAIEAAQIYPTTGAVAQIAAGVDQIGTLRPDGNLTIRRNGSMPALPHSAFGTLGLLAATVDQQGIVRAPLGSLLVGSNADPFIFGYSTSSTVVLRPGSITSTSAAELVMPYGGTVDGLSYKYAGADVAFHDLASFFPTGRSSFGVTLSGKRVVAEHGAVLDLSGGGNLTGAAFISGRGGSVDILKTPLVNANPVLGYSDASNRVYALMPAYASGYAPMSPEKAAGDPLVGQQITLTQAVGGLPAGTYTLLPSNYALLPGAYRVELGRSTTTPIGPAALANGSYVTTGTLGVVNTGIHSALPSRIIVTPGQAVRSHSQYNETSYSDFVLANAAASGRLRPRLPVDAQTLLLSFGSAVGDVLSFDGTVLMQSGDGGYAGTLAVSSTGALEIKPSGTVATAGMASLDAEDLSRVGAGSLLIGGNYSYVSGQNDTSITSAHVYLSATAADVVVRNGSVLEAGQIFALARNSVHVENGAVFDTTRSSTNIFDSSAGYVFWNSLSGSFANTGAILAVSNGWLNFLPVKTAAAGTVTINDGAAFRTLGTIAFAASNALDLGANVALNARYITLSLPEINVGTDASLAAARGAGALGSGWLLTQSALDRLLTPANPTLPRAERLTLTVGSSLNFFGDVDLDMRSPGGGSKMLVLNTPAIYGWGTVGDVATLSADTVIWNGVSSGQGTTASPYVSLPPGAVRPGGPGTGAGALAINAREIVFGYDPYARPQNEATLDRLALGFATVNLAASDRITANNRGSLAVYRSGTGASNYAGGDLTISAPLITAEAGGLMSFVAGGAITARAGAGGPANTDSVSQVGGELRFKGSAITIDTAIAMPSGRLELKATGDITLTDRATLDLSARSITFFDVTKYSWGGDIVMESAAGVITQHAGSIIDVSAARNDAGSIRAEALGTGGTVAFHGALRGAAADGFDSGSFDVRAFTLADFAGLNTKLSESGYFSARNFVIKTGDLVIGNEVRAREVNISVDGGSLMVTGRINASGAKPGSIRLAARDDLTLTSSAILDARSTVLQVDSTGAPIEASNRGHVELTSAQGTVRLATGATIDLRSADNVARGKIEINAQRRGGAGGAGAGADDIAIDAAGPLDIRGAASIAVNGFRSYEPTRGIINQSLLDAIHTDSSAFINAASMNGALQSRLTGLRAYGDAFHLRPGVELRSNGDLATEGDVDFSGYRYGPNADPGVRGSGEPGVLVVRAAGNVTIKGSINDGFAPPPATPDDNGWVLLPGSQPADVWVGLGVTLAGGPSGAVTTFAAGASSTVVLDYAISIRAATLRKGVAVPFQFVSTGVLSVPDWARAEGGWIATAPIWASAAAQQSGQPPIFTPGQKVNVQLPTGTVFGAGTVLPAGTPQQAGTLGIAAVTVPAGTPLNVFDNTVTLNANVVVPAGARIPAQTNVVLTTTPIGSISAPLTLSSGLILIGNASGTATTFPGGATSTTALTFAISIRNATLRRGVSIPFQFASSANLAVPSWATAQGGWVATAPIWASTNAYSQGQPPLFTAGQRVNVTLPSGTVFGAGTVLPSLVATTTSGTLGMFGAMVPAGTPLNVFNSAVTLSASVAVAAGTVLPAGTNIQQVISAPLRPSGSDGRQGQMWAVAPMLAPGSLSWSMRMASGADLSSADSRTLRSADLPEGQGNIRLYDPHYTIPYDITTAPPAISVVRTGTGYLELLAGGDYRQDSLFGVYTAGQATGGLGRARRSDGTVLGPGNAAYEAALNPIGIYFTEHGGDVLLAAGGSIGGYLDSKSSSSATYATSDVAGWSWMQDGNWGINFGTYDASSALFLRGFAGIGALGGGNVTVRADADAGQTKTGGPRTPLTAAIGSSGQAQAGGNLVRHGGGTLTLDIAGQLNPADSVFTPIVADIANLRGDIMLRAASVGRVIASKFGVRINLDPRPSEPLVPSSFAAAGTQRFSLGDATLVLQSRSDIVATVNAAGSLWADTTAAELFSAGGEIVPIGDVPSLSIIAARGSIHTGQYSTSSVRLLPSPIGQLELLAWNSINGDIPSGGSNYVGLSAGAPFSNLHIEDPEPIRIYAVNGDIIDLQVGESRRDSLTGIWTHDPVGKHAWMRAGRDIVKSGLTVLNNRGTDVSIVSAGRDIILAEMNGYNYQVAGPGTLEITAGRNIILTDPSSSAAIGPFISIGALVAGDLRPGADIVVQAGVGTIGPNYAAFAARYLDPANLAQPGIPLADQAGKVAKAYDEELFAWLQNRFGPHQRPFVHHGRTFVFSGGKGDALAFFLSLPTEQQGVFLRGVYYEELRLSGREYNDSTSTRFGSYLRGREAIEALFPETDANGAPIQRNGDITIFGGAHIRTDFGGNIQMLAPGGKIIVGIEGEVPPSTAGIVTQGAGDIQMYSKGSVLLGLSRIMTTFGGDIIAWSAEGDINAGRGAKTTIVYSPPKRVYDNYGAVTLSPNAPSSGAGIATLSPVAGLPPGNIDLIAPLGTIDAGEAGIRSSGNVNLAALQIVNAANIQAEGNTTGVPTVQAPNIGGLTEASNTAGAAAQQAAIPTQNTATAQPSIIIVEVLGFGGGSGETPENGDVDRRRNPDQQSYDPNSRLQVIGLGQLSAEQKQQLAEDERRNLAGR
ncbi:filamentous hemagglutinin family protein [Bradyrhizobium sp. WSM 1738]|uniref:filamentous haemagglutinin family protein n=1 Tax=Bradyrhizobium hereditatis TaxID=2821405 RepID=UPI001CE31E37|nr:filamentous haemagglutinin family protein [Bradyrhizobium hereditatis]MCA6119336.1 filamentous hemagglutinin family protein [Bradyrhizobium hereditatis]